MGEEIPSWKRKNVDAQTIVRVLFKSSLLAPEGRGKSPPVLELRKKRLSRALPD